MGKAFIAIDLGASSGRVILGRPSSDKIILEEIHRFKNGPIHLRKSLHVNFLYILQEIKIGLKKISKIPDTEVMGIGIDTWGVDYGWLDKNGDLLYIPYHYRDDRTSKVIPEVHNIISEDEIYARSGIQHFPFNSIYQIYYDVHVKKVLEHGADQLLFMPNLFAYFLTGNRTWERTISSTGAIIDSETKDWSSSIFEDLKIPGSIVGDLVDPGTLNGLLTKEIQDETGLGQVPVFSIAGHDSASAIIGAPIEKDGLFLISGTWSLLGLEAPKAFNSPEAKTNGFTNELGYKCTRCLKLITGLWIIQELKKQWNLKGEQLDFPDIIKLAEQSTTTCSINPADERFNYSIDMESEVKDYCKTNGQSEPKTYGDIAKAVYNGITDIYITGLKDISELTGKTYSVISMIGGGIQDDYLCRLTAEKLQIKVNAGPIEASVYGNIICQMISTGHIKNIDEGREIVKRSFEIKEY
ncbi:MAG: rhamnulokinase [Spirochaetaceae bacterium]